jgi:nucleoside-diphosphate kinase
MIQRSLVLMKPDAVKRGIVGEILSRLERAGLKIVGMKIVQVGEELGSKHYNHGEEWQLKVGARNIQDCNDYGLSVMECFGTEDPKEIGKIVDKRNAEFLASGPVIAIVLEGVNAVAKIRSLVGSTFPDTAAPGTIRGDFGMDSAFAGMKRQRTTYNMIHASGSPEEAEEEIKLWFDKDDVLAYKRVQDDLYGY